MKVYQVTLRGFDGSTEKTDHLIIWVKSPSIEGVSFIITENNLDYISIDETSLALDVPGIDYEVFENKYEHCGIAWTDCWTSQCNDECPICGKEVEPINC